MGAETVVEKVRAIAERVAGGYGLEVFDVQFRREAPGMVLRVQIDRPGPASKEEDSVGVADCASVSRDLSAIFDVEDIVPTAYTLEVSSPGLDRPLRGLDDYRRFTGRLVPRHERLYNLDAAHVAGVPRLDVKPIVQVAVRALASVAIGGPPAECL